MEIEGWKYYNHAAIPDYAPHEKVNKRPIEDGSIWKLGGVLGHYLPDGLQILIVDMRRNGGM